MMRHSSRRVSNWDWTGTCHKKLKSVWHGYSTKHKFMGQAKQQKEHSLVFDLTMKTQLVLLGTSLLMEAADQAYIFDM